MKERVCKETIEKTHWDNGTVATSSGIGCQPELHSNYP